MRHPRSNSLIAFVGPSGSGKTVLLERLISTLSAQGLSIGALKHTHHCMKLDEEHRDSGRFLQAGATTTLLATPKGLRLITSCLGHDLDTLVSLYFSKVDLVLAEGFSEGSHYKILVHRREGAHLLQEWQYSRCENLIASVSDYGLSLHSLPYFHLDDISVLSSFLMKFAAIPENRDDR